MSCNVAEFSRAFQKHTKGASLTRVRASSTWRALARFAKEKKMILSPDKMTSKQLMRFVEYRIEAGISARSIQNEVSHIRRSLEGSGRDPRWPPQTAPLMAGQTAPGRTVGL